MDGFYAGAVAGANSIVAQISALNWALILSMVGLATAFAEQEKRAVQKKKLGWIRPLLLGLMAGMVNFMATAPAGDRLAWAGGLVLSALTYCGWVTFSYHFTLRPIKYAGDWLKRKSRGEKPAKEA